MQYFNTKKNHSLLPLIGFCLLFTFSSCAVAAKQSLTLANINKDIVVDGIMDEPHWKEATHVPLNFQDEPNEKGTPPVKTDAYIYQDEHNLYVAFVAYDPDPSQIRAALTLT